MSRTIMTPCPDAPKLQVDLKAETDEHYPDHKIKTYLIKVITPIFGGGVEAGENDPITLIRPSSIRGHLRFWWRATRGANFRSEKELYHREGEIWGTTDNPSSVELEVNISILGVEEACASVPPQKNYYKILDDYPSYALFPFQGNKREDIEPSKARKDLSFSLTICFPEGFRKDIEASIWAWVNFGGIGARTRRGCGALLCKVLAPPDEMGLEVWFQKKKKYYGISEFENKAGWPRLGSTFFVSKTPTLPVVAWKKAIDLMHQFRQGTPNGRNSGKNGNRFGRSLWPEADSIRAISHLGDPNHKSSITLENLEEAPAFPRAEFGLPIIFQFPKEPKLKAPEVYPKNKTRMASPIILRPLAFGNGTKAVPMVLKLSTPPVNEITLKVKRNPQDLERDFGETNIRRPELSRYPNSPMNRSEKGSALEAFIAFAIEKGFEEIDK